MINRLRKWWAARQRAIDLQILWPACKENAQSLIHAREAFFVHASMDPAWLILGEDELIRQIEALS